MSNALPTYYVYAKPRKATETVSGKLYSTPHDVGDGASSTSELARDRAVGCQDRESTIPRRLYCIFFWLKLRNTRLPEGYIRSEVAHSLATGKVVEIKLHIKALLG